MKTWNKLSIVIFSVSVIYAALSFSGVIFPKDGDNTEFIILLSIIITGIIITAAAIAFGQTSRKNQKGRVLCILAILIAPALLWDVLALLIYFTFG